MLFLFYGSGWKPSQYYSRLRFAVVDLDGGLVGASALGGAQTLAYSVALMPGSSLESIRQDVDTGVYHAAVVANRPLLRGDEPSSLRSDLGADVSLR
jgi:hypothetical protein